MLYSIALLALALSSLSHLEVSEQQWIAYEQNTTAVTLIEIPNYGEMFQLGGALCVGSYVTFVESNGEDNWRAVIVYSDRVILFQEDQDPITTLHDFPVDYLCFSDSGNYVVFFETADEDENNGRNGMRINTITGDMRYFDSRPMGFKSYESRVWDDGSIMFARCISYKRLTEYYFINALMNETTVFEGTYPRTLGYSENFFLVCNPPQGITCFSRSGEIKWKITDHSTTSPALFSISDNEQYFLMSEGEQNETTLQLRSMITGQLLREYSLPYERVSFAPPVFSLDGEEWICSACFLDQEGNNDVFRKILLRGRVSEDATDTVSFPDMHGGSYHIIEVSDSCLLMWMWAPNREESRYVLSNLNYSPIFASSAGRISGIQAEIQGTYPEPGAALSSSGLRLILTDQNQIQIIELGE